jgi:predicted lipoprotein
MSASATPVSSPRRASRRKLIAAAAAAVLVGAMALDTKVVSIGSQQDVRTAVFSPEAYGQSEFPKVQADIEARAVDAVTLATAISSDRATAEKEYGVPAGVGPVMSVKLSGVVGEGKSGVYDVVVPGLPPELRVRVQTGPAINGTELRDATGKITFGQFKNQIEYQDAGSALNNEMKKQVLANVDTKALGGKTITVVGAFKLVNPKSWLVTPIRLVVQ